MKNLKQESFIEHNKQYETTSNLSWHIEEYKKNDSIKLFELMGFRRVFEEVGKDIKIHIDLGSGGGYLVNKSSNFFEYVYGIEPSKAAIEISKEITKSHSKIIFINSGMVDGIQNIDFKSQPFLVTTSAVLSHIDDDHVTTFLNLLNKIATPGSKLYFYEPYDKNININLWHVRNKFWWIDRLSGWKLKFYDVPDCGYKKGIEGEYMGGDCRSINYSRYPSNFIKELSWKAQGIFYKLRYAASKFIK